MKQKILGLLTVFLGVCFLTSCPSDSDPEPVEIKVESITLDRSELSMTVGQTETLRVSISPENATNKDIEWKSTNTAIATVEDGVIEAVAPGTADIMALCGNESARCKVVVNAAYIAVEEITLDKTELSMAVGQTETLKASIFPENATDKDIEWASTDSSIAQVEDGVVKAIATGSAEISATCGNVSAKCTVTVNFIAVEKITLDNEKISMDVGQTKTIQASIVPSDATSQKIEWESSNPSVATVRDGVVKAIAEGMAIVTATIGEISATCTINVRPEHQYQYVYGYVYSEDLLKFLTPIITLKLDGKAPVVYSIGDGHNTSAEQSVSFGDIHLSVSPKTATIWWIGKSYETAQNGSLEITYERKDVDFSQYDDVGLSSFFFISEPYVCKSNGNMSICTPTWISISINDKHQLQEKIDEIVKSSPKTISF